MTSSIHSDKPDWRVQLVSLFHFLIAAVVLVAVPMALNDFLKSLFFPRSVVWVQRGELTPWPIATLDEFFLAAPYWNSYEPGWFLGLVPGLLMAFVAWGLWKQRRWARQFGLAFWGLLALAATCVAIGSICYCLTNLDGGSLGLGGLVLVIFAIVGGVAIGILLVSCSMLWTLRRLSTRANSTATKRVSVVMLLAGCVATLCTAVALELAYNRISVYRGDARYRGQPTGQWLTLLASCSPQTRRSVMQELAESEESVPVLREIFRGKPGRTETVIERDYFSRAHSAISRQLREEEIFGRPLVLALTDLARDSDSDVRRAAFRVLRGSSLEAPEILATILAGLTDEHAEVRKEAITVLAETSDEVKQNMLPQLRALTQNPQCDPTVYRSIIRWVDPEEADRLELQELAEQLVGGDTRTRRQALRKLGEFEGYAAERVPALMAALDDPDLSNRCTAAYALGKIGSAAKDAIPRLASALQSDDRMRSAAATALGSMGPDAKAAAPDLQRMLEDSNLHDRVVAAEALWRIDGQADVVTPVLHEVLSSRDPRYSYTRVKAAEVLWDIERQIDEVFLILRRATSSKEAGKVLEKIETDCVSADEKRALAICYLRHAPFEKQKIALHSYEKAAELLTAISESDRIAADWGLLGQALYRTDRWDDALRALEQANECRGETKPTLKSGPRWWYLVLTFARLGENEQATAHYERLVGELMKASPHDLPRHKKLRAEAARLLGINIE